jgi:hypothetical protein
LIWNTRAETSNLIKTSFIKRELLMDILLSQLYIIVLIVLQATGYSTSSNQISIDRPLNFGR